MKGEYSGKNKRRFYVKSGILGFIKKVFNFREKFLILLVSAKLILFVSLVLVNMFRFLMLSNLQKNNKSLKTNSQMNIIITSRSNKTNFYSNCNSIEMPFDDGDHHTFVNSKYCNINESTPFEIKQIIWKT